jgi:putative tryptophan/tyrosine transport system substrate-binding protein
MPASLDHHGECRRRLLAQAVALPFASQSLGTFARGRPLRLWMVTWRGHTDVERGFTDYWRQHAKSQERDVEFIWRDVAQSRKVLAEVQTEIVRERADVVYSWGTTATVGLAGAYDAPHAVIGRTVPLIFAAVADPIAARIVPTAAQDTKVIVRNITGVSHVAPIAQQFAAMRAYAPVRGVGMMYNKLESNSIATRIELMRIADVAEVPLIALPFRLNSANEPQIDGASEMILQMQRAGANWLYLGPDSFLFTKLAEVAVAAKAARMLTFAATESHLNSAAPVLMGLVSKFYQVGQFAAFKTLQRLRGNDSVPVETLKRFSLIVRLDVAHALDTYPPLSLIDQAEFRQGTVAM